MSRWWPVVCLVCVGATQARAEVGPQVLYLNFSDGTEDIVRADGDDPAHNRSIMGTASPYPAFAWPDATTIEDRRALIRHITAEVNQAFLPYNLLVTTVRPTSGPYTMVVVGGGPALFAMDARVAGVAYMDCDNHQASNVVFAFPEPLGDNEHGLFSTIAQEAAHAFGLQHSTDPNDIMYPRVDLQQVSFQDRESPVAKPRFCGSATQNSHRRLLEILGPWMGGPKPSSDFPAMAEDGTDTLVGGCSVGSTRSGGGGLGSAASALALVFALRACRRRRGRL
jgi:hypothetical protein